MIIEHKRFGIAYFGDSREILKDYIKDNLVGLVVTSPPYKDEDGYSDNLIIEVFTEVFRVQQDNTLLFLNFGHLAEDKFRPFKVCSLLMNIGYKLNDTIIWVKNHYRPIQGNKRLNNLTEFIFLLYKGEMPSLNRLAIGIPYIDKSNAKRFNNGMDLHCGGNVWYIDYETINNKNEKIHNDRFPIELPAKCIKLCGYPIGTVLDPFAGSFTTCVAASKLEQQFIGIEKNLIHFENGINRL